MAKLSSDGKYVTVERGDTLSGIASKYAGGASNYTKLAAINKISNPNRIYVGQKIYLTSSSSGGSSGSGSSSSSSSKKSTPSKAKITEFGEQSDADGVLYAVWDWSKSNTESYKVLWTYDTGDGVWFEGSNTTNTVDKDTPSMARQSTYNIPSNAVKVRFKVKPISKKYTKNKKETSYWTASWSDTKTWTNDTPLETPPVPTVEIEKLRLTASLDNLTIKATGIEFEVVKNDGKSSFSTGPDKIVSSHASYSCNVDAGGEYKVRCRAYKGSSHSEWSAYSANQGTIPSAPSEITKIKGQSATEVYLKWSSVKSATSYEIEYATKKNYLGTSNQSTSQNTTDKTNYFTIGGLTSGEEYFFRVRAVNEKGTSEWCEAKSVKIGKEPAAPTTWSSTTTAVVGEPLKLYWVHNSADGSNQTKAQVELKVGSTTNKIDVEDNRDEDDRDKAMELIIDTSGYSAGAKLLWRVRTQGVLADYSPWSIQRTVDIYATPTLAISVEDKATDGNELRTVTTFPFYIKGEAGPSTQTPTGYHVTVISNETYETVDNVGNEVTVSKGDEIFSKYVNASKSKRNLSLKLSAGDINLENGVSYTVKCVVSMNSGLTDEATKTFIVKWSDITYEPNAEISIDTNSYTAEIPLCHCKTHLWWNPLRWKIRHRWR